jgi:hypothetical protein
VPDRRLAKSRLRPQAAAADNNCRLRFCKWDNFHETVLRRPFSPGFVGPRILAEERYQTPYDDRAEPCCPSWTQIANGCWFWTASPCCRKELLNVMRWPLGSKPNCPADLWGQNPKVIPNGSVHKGFSHTFKAHRQSRLSNKRRWGAEKKPFPPIGPALLVTYRHAWRMPQSLLLVGRFHTYSCSARL